jgi:hypothetical protein
MVQGRVLTGNAVPPLLAEALAWAVKQALDGNNLECGHKNRAKGARKRALQMALL